MPERDPEQIITLFKQTHNLSEIAERPYTLSLLVDEIAGLEAMSQQGKIINGASLYQRIVQKWLERDDGKETFEPRHKTELMQWLAVDLWKKGKQSWHINDIEDWLMDFLYKNPRIDRHYRTTLSDLLKEDFRTATFLVHENDTDFKFAHRSLQEFFLASALFDGLLQTDLITIVSVWSLSDVSPETWLFLAQIIETSDQQSQALSGLRQLHLQFNAKASQSAFNYALIAHQQRAYWSAD